MGKSDRGVVDDLPAQRIRGARDAARGDKQRSRSCLRQESRGQNEIVVKPISRSEGQDLNAGRREVRTDFPVGGISVNIEALRVKDRRGVVMAADNQRHGRGCAIEVGSVGSKPHDNMQDIRRGPDVEQVAGLEL